MTKQIPLTQEQVALVDDWRYEELNQWGWQALWDKKTQSFYAVRTERQGLLRKAIYLHRQIMSTPKGMLCDHINRNTLDNQDHNLRNATYSQNNMNARVRSNNKLGEKCIHQRRNGYAVRIYKDHKCVFDKTFKTLGDAILARDVALQQFHGEYAQWGRS